MSPGITIPILPLTVRLAKVSSESFDNDSIDGIDVADAELLMQTLSVAHCAVVRLRLKFEEALTEGMESRDLAIFISPLEEMRPLTLEMEENARRFDEAAMNGRSAHVQALREKLQELLTAGQAINRMVDLVKATLAMPLPPFDPAKAQAAREAIERGEFRSFEPGMFTKRK